MDPKRRADRVDRVAALVVIAELDVELPRLLVDATLVLAAEAEAERGGPSEPILGR